MTPPSHGPAPRDWSRFDADYHRIDPDDVPPGALGTAFGFALSLAALGWLAAALLGAREDAPWWEIAGTAVLAVLFAVQPLFIESQRRRFRREHPHYRQWARDYARRGRPLG